MRPNVSPDATLRLTPSSARSAPNCFTTASTTIGSPLAAAADEVDSWAGCVAMAISPFLMLVCAVILVD